MLSRSGGRCICKRVYPSRFRFSAKEIGDSTYYNGWKVSVLLFGKKVLRRKANTGRDCVSWYLPAGQLLDGRHNIWKGKNCIVHEPSFPSLPNPKTLSNFIRLKSDPVSRQDTSLNRCRHYFWVMGIRVPRALYLQSVFLFFMTVKPNDSLLSVKVTSTFYIGNRIQ